MGEDLVEHKCSIKGRIHVGSFWKGKRCVQVTIGVEYAQMTFTEAKTFFKESVEAIEKLEKEYNENAPWWERMAK